MPKKVIVAEDEQVIRDDIVEEIRSRYPQASVSSVNNGRSLVESVGKGGYSLVLTDDKMPEMDGFAAIRQIRQLDENVPIYMLAINDVRKEALAAGATGCIDKLYYEERLPPVLKKHLG